MGLGASWARALLPPVTPVHSCADAQNVLARGSHRLGGAELRVRPAPPWDPTRLLLRGPGPQTAPEALEPHLEPLLGRPCSTFSLDRGPGPDWVLLHLRDPITPQGGCGDPGGAALTLAAVPCCCRECRAVVGVRGLRCYLVALQAPHTLCCPGLQHGLRATEQRWGHVGHVLPVWCHQCWGCTRPARHRADAAGCRSPAVGERRCRGPARGLIAVGVLVVPSCQA